MKRFMFSLVIVAFCFSGVSGAGDGWLEGFDGFDEYPVSPVPEPWEGDADLAAHRGIGHNGTAGIQNPGRGWGHACRAVVVDTPHVGDAIIARILLPAGLDRRQLGFGLTTGKSPDEAGSRAQIHITSRLLQNPSMHGEIVHR